MDYFFLIFKYLFQIFFCMNILIFLWFLLIYDSKLKNNIFNQIEVFFFLKKILFYNYYIIWYLNINEKNLFFILLHSYFILSLNFFFWYMYNYKIQLDTYIKLCIWRQSADVNKSFINFNLISYNKYLV